MVETGIGLVILWVFGTLIIATLGAILAKHYGIEYLIALYAGAIVAVAATASKLVVFGDYAVSASIIVFSITFFLTDLISEFWGKEAAQRAVWAGLLANILFLFVSWVAVHWQPASFWEGQEAFAQVFGATGRITIASITAYVLAQNHDVWAYHFWKRVFNSKHLWARNNFSTIVSQMIDSVVFVTIAFYGLVPVLPIIISTIIVKFIIAILDTPFLYAVRWYYHHAECSRPGSRTK